VLRRVIGYAIPAVIVLVAAGFFVLLPRGSSTAGDRIAWFVAPVDGDQLTTGQVTVIAGATDPMGIAVLELSVDGEFVEGRLYEGAPERVDAEFAWLANLEGNFRLSVRARGTDGVWGVPQTIVVTTAHLHPSDEGLSPQTTTTSTSSTTTTTQAASTTRPATTTTTTTTTQPQAPPSSTPSTSTSTTSTTVGVTSCEPTNPSLDLPPNDAIVDNPPVLEWEYKGADPCRPDSQTLRFTGSTESGGGELLVDLPRWATNWRPPRLDDCTSYTWKVFAQFGGQELKSAIWSFTTDFSGDC
jgi:hypothetical protein